MSVTLTVELDGGIFERPDSIADSNINDAMTELGEVTVQRVQRNLDGVLVNPTGHYRSRIDYTLVRPHSVEVHDSGVVYGPWLEGISSRNVTTRFKGYSTFRKTLDEVEKDVDQIIRRNIDQMAKELE